MGAFMGYMVQVAIVMTILYLVYKLMISGLPFHSFNRKIILGIYAVSWTLPAFAGLISLPSANPANIEIGPMEITSVVVVEGAPQSSFDWTSALALAYGIGLSVMSALTVLSVCRMANLIRSGNTIESSEYIVRVSDKAPGPFSWARFIIVRPSDLDDSLGLVLRHEKAHLRKMHWIDLIPARITVILQWFSPAAWLLARELKEIHEFEVDRIAGEENIYEYQLMLIKKTAGSRFPVFADSLNHSQIKKRLTMMRKKSNPKRRVAALALPFAACAASLLISLPLVAGVVDKLTNVELFTFADGKINENDSNLQIVKATERSGKVGSTALSVSPSHLEREDSYGEIRNELFADNVDRSDDEKKDGRTKVTYFVDGKEYKGSISDIDPSTIASMQIVKNDPAYPDNKVLITTKPADSSEGKVQPAIDKMAQFKGGEKALLAFLTENIKYPSSAKMESDGKTVRVILSFDILTDGSVGAIEIKRSGGEAFDAEAIDVIAKTSGRWEPAEENGKPVVSQFTIPITFKQSVSDTE